MFFSHFLKHSEVMYQVMSVLPDDTDYQQVIDNISSNLKLCHNDYPNVYGEENLTYTCHLLQHFPYFLQK